MTELAIEGDKIEVKAEDMGEFLELLDGYKTMLLSHEKRIGIVETLLANTIAAAPKRPQDHRRRVR